MALRARTESGATAALLLALSGAALTGVVVAWILARRKASTLQHVGFAFVLAGALGNVVDRLVRGFVVDFIHVARWPIFNVADVAVVVGTILLVFGRVRETKKKDGGASPPAPAIT